MADGLDVVSVKIERAEASLIATGAGAFGLPQMRASSTNKSPSSARRSRLHHLLWRTDNRVLPRTGA